jgi:AcrR family transcriptional regulator
MDFTARRLSLKEALIAAAERTIASRGLAGLRARELAADAGCAVGAIYNVFADLDDLVLAVNGRTLAALEQALAGAAAKTPDPQERTDLALDSLVRSATAYLDFAAADTLRWRALFDHRLPAGKALPDWYLADQVKLFAYIEQPLRALQPDLAPEERALLARSLFSAVHGLVSLGLEEKLGAVPLGKLREQVALVTRAMARGLFDR